MQIRSFTNEDSGPGGIVVEVTFEVKFIQSTIFRYMIDSSTTVEVQKWFTEYFVHIKQVCEEYKENPDSTINSRIKELIATKKQVEHKYDSSSSNTLTTTSLLQQGKVDSATAIVDSTTLIKRFRYMFNQLIQSSCALDYKDRAILLLLILLCVLTLYCVHIAVVLKKVELTVMTLVANYSSLERELRELRQHTCEVR